MAKKISQLPPASVATGTEQFEAVQNGNSVRLTLDSMLDRSCRVYQVPEGFQNAGNLGVSGATDSPDNGFYEATLNGNISGSLVGEITMAYVEIFSIINDRQIGSTEPTFGFVLSYNYSRGEGGETPVRVEVFSQMVGSQILPDPESTLFPGQSKYIWVPVMHSGDNYWIDFHFEGRGAGDVYISHDVLAVMTNTQLIEYLPA